MNKLVITNAIVELRGLAEADLETVLWKVLDEHPHVAERAVARCHVALSWVDNKRISMMGDTLATVREYHDGMWEWDAVRDPDEVDESYESTRRKAMEAADAVLAASGWKLAGDLPSEDDDEPDEDEIAQAADDLYDIEEG